MGLFLAGLMTLLVVSCGSSNDSKTGSKKDGGTFCQTGTAGCGCSGSFPCQDKGYACVNGTCVMCQAGTENCPCDNNTCQGGLSCVEPDPTCNLDCLPKICVKPNAQDGGSDAATCGPTQLCNRTIQECKQSITQQDCEAFYTSSGNCTDIAAYTTCNCNCITEATCSDYFACGNICFNDHCK